MSERPLRIAVLLPATGLIDGEICDIAEERGAQALIFKVAPPFVADAADADAVARMTQGMGSPSLLARIAGQAADVAADAVVWACTSGSFLGPADGRSTQAQAMSQALGGVPATTTSLAFLDGLAEHGLRHVAVVTPYHAQIGGKFARYLADHGYMVDGEAHAGCGSDEEVGRLTYADLAPLAHRAVRPGTQALAIPCTGLRRQDIVDRLQKELGMPVLLANEVTMNHAVKLARNHARMTGYPVEPKAAQYLHEADQL